MSNHAERAWRKSSHSGGSGTGNCVEVATGSTAAQVRDSKNASGPRLAFPAATWRNFLGRIDRTA